MASVTWHDSSGGGEGNGGDGNSASESSVGGACCRDGHVTFNVVALSLLDSSGCDSALQQKYITTRLDSVQLTTAAVRQYIVHCLALTIINKINVAHDF